MLALSAETTLGRPKKNLQLPGNPPVRQLRPRFGVDVRLFMAPGVQHCGGGPGSNPFNAIAALERWVEEGNAPDRIIASRVTENRVDMTRPLCPYPQVARLSMGSANEPTISCARRQELRLGGESEWNGHGLKRTSDGRSAPHFEVTRVSASYAGRVLPELR
jgi:hypothetical protein